MEHIVDILHEVTQQLQVSNTTLNDPYPLVLHSLTQIGPPASREIVQYNDFPYRLLGQLIYEMGAEKPTPTDDQHATLAERHSSTSPVLSVRLRTEVL